MENMQVECLYCGSIFNRRKSHVNKKTFCSKRCDILFKKENPIKGENHKLWKRIKKTCEVCGREFIIKSSRIKSAKYCSKKCLNIKRMTKVERKCEICGRTFFFAPGRLKHKSKGRFCSQSCMGKSMAGCNSKWWAGGVTAIRNKIRNLPEYRQWRKSVFIRDNWTCKSCGKKGGNLEAHHIIKFSDLLLSTFNKIDEDCLNVVAQKKDLWDLNNGVTLCRACHKYKFHNWRTNEEI